MRRRNDTLRTGSLLAHYAAEDRQNNRGLLFLIAGMADVDPLTRAERACRRILEERQLSGFEWLAVPDEGQLVDVDPLLNPNAITRVEASELAGLDDAALARILRPALERLAAGQPELFPTAGGAVGGPARDVQFLDREAELAALEKNVKAGVHTLLRAPRRSGKTSLLYRLQRALEGDFRVHHLDLQRDLSPENLAARLWADVRSTGIRQARVEVGRLGWAEALRQVLAGTGGRPVLLLDELVFLLQNLPDEERPAEAHKLLAQLGRVAQAVGAVLVVAGSLDLGDYLAELEDFPGAPPPFDRLAPVALAPLAAAVVAVELRRVLLGTGLVLEDGDDAWMAEHVDLALPYAGLRFLDDLAARVRRQGRLSTAELDEAWTKFLRTTDAFRELETQLNERAQRTGKRDELERALDRLVDANHDGVDEADLKHALGEHLPWLLDTFPLYNDREKVRVASQLFRGWWQSRQK